MCAFLLFLVVASASRGDEFRVLPYVQNPSPDAITIRWLSNSNEPGTIEFPKSEHKPIRSTPVLASTLGYNSFKEEPNGPHPALPWIHTVRIEGLKPSTDYRYTVTQGKDTHPSSFRTAPGKDEPVRLIVYSDSETEPESSTTDPVAWPVSTGSNRPDGVKNYLVNQTAGYVANCNVIQSRQPNLILLVGDLVEAGGEQRDWDEFWRHNAGQYSALASSIPILPSLGNHENYAGPGGGYDAAAANFATDKYLTYFDVPDNGASNPKHKGRYYRLDYGPLTLISLDSSDGLPHKTAADTNYNLEGSNAPDFNPGSEQYVWLETQLADAQKKSRFTFVQFHHTMFGSGPHSIPFGQEGFSGQAGIPMRVLLPLFMKYGVDLVFSGHDELLERSYVQGEEQQVDGKMHPHSIHLYDAGIGGDGLRGSSVGFDNPHRQFLAHEHAPEVWENGRLISGGKHYGHLEVDVQPSKDGRWTIEVTPVHAFPKCDEQGEITWERRTYADVVRITE